MHSPSKPSTWTLIQLWIKCFFACSCSSNIYILLRLVCLINPCVLLYIVEKCVASCLLSSNALKTLMIVSGCWPSWWFWSPMNSDVTYNMELSGAARSALGGKTLHVAALFSRLRARAWGLSSLISKETLRRWNGDYLRQLVEIVIVGVPTLLEVQSMCLFMSLSWILLQGYISTNLFDPMRH